MKNAATLRSPEVGGFFYPAEAGPLREMVEEFIRRVPPTTERAPVMGLVSPHAGYQYSGATAACGYAAVRHQAFDVVVVVAPSHREAFRGVSVYPGGGYRTPLGTVPVHEDLREELVRETAVVRALDAGHRGEHAVEVQLPFLQTVLGPFSFLPIVMGEQDRAVCAELGRALAATLKGASALLVASTDLSHFHHDGLARRLDRVVAEDILRFDAEGLMDHLEQGDAEACGGGPTVAVMTALRTLGATRMTVLHQCNSGDITGDGSSVVGYLSAAAYA